MVKRCLYVLLLTAVFTGSLFSFVFPASAEESSAGGTVTAYYFHGTFRCFTCFTLEQYSKEAIENNFKGALASGKLEFKAVNVEEKGNEHYTSDYQLYTKSLVLSLVKDGKEIRYKNLTKIWEYVRDRRKFTDYVTSEINGFMKDEPK